MTQPYRHLIIYIFLLLILPSRLSAQIISRHEVEERAPSGNAGAVKTARDMAGRFPLDDDGALTLTTYIDCPGQSRDELYGKVAAWALRSLSDDFSRVLLRDRVKGRIQFDTFFPQMARRTTMGDNSYNVGICPQVCVDLKDGRARVTFTLRDYRVVKSTVAYSPFFVFGNNNNNQLGISASAVSGSQIWPVRDCHPYTRESAYPKVTASRAYVNAVICSDILSERITAVLLKSSPDADDDW